MTRLTNNSLSSNDPSLSGKYYVLYPNQFKSKLIKKGLF